MSMLILDKDLVSEIKAKRSALGLDKHDEVWEAEIVVMPVPNNQHQTMATDLACAIKLAFGWANPHQIAAGANVSDRVLGWVSNFRAPDVVVYLDSNPARNCVTHWCGGPDFLAEIISDDDRSRDKLTFYASINSREVLIIDRDPWALELYSCKTAALPWSVNRLSLNLIS